MTTITHIMVGAAIAKAALSGAKINADPQVLYAVSILFSNIPDIDIPLFGLKKSIKLEWNHRVQSFLHFPITWAIAFLLFWLLAPAGMKESATPYMPVAAIGVMLHFILDTVGIHNGICWLGPFVKKEISFTKLMERPRDTKIYLLTYSTSFVFKLEMLLWIGAIWYLFIRR